MERVRGGRDTFEVKINKHIGQPLVFKREDFLTDYETKTLFSPEPVSIPELVQNEIDFSKDNDTPF